MKIGRIEFSPVSRIRFTTDPRIRPIVTPINETAEAVVQLQALVADLIERVERLEKMS